MAMPIYFLDQHAGDEIEIDREGTDLLDLSTAKSLAFELLGESIILERARLPLGEVAIVVRDESGAVLRVSAKVAVEELSPPQTI
ncbi:hypothetical protein [Bradyrhizobium sp. 192]|uniref:DUF6894 family protein n=1 Tax=Bradyrhizobium sp. 192 TaxID=2782660 RepID=UPI00200033CE|nr:hypothetical protein [Bradyrhizobium sp. 192]UPJ55426.1 hypothetical protein IVB24_22475 [Bradyrhizobium sp. 192]